MFKKMLITLSVACMLGLFAAGSAFALTPSGTVISNTANATYKDINGGTMTPAVSNTVVVNVTQVAFVGLNIAVTPLNGEPGDAPVFTLTVTNNGNAADTFDLTPAALQGSSTFTPSGSVLYYSDLACTTPITKTPSVPYTAGTNTYTFYMKVSIPLTAVDGNDAYEKVVATSEFDNTQSANATADTHVQEGHVALTKTVDNATPVAGNVITYTITATNTGTSTAKTISVTDDLTAMDAIATYKAGSLKIDGASVSDPTFVANVMTISSTTYPTQMTDLAPAGVHTIVFQMTVNNSVVDQTAKSNTAAVTYGPGGPKTGTPPPAPPTVTVQAPLISVVKSVSADGITYGPGPMNAKPGAKLYYQIITSNGGHSNATVVSVTDILDTTDTTFDAGSATASTTGTGSTTAGESAGTVTGTVDTLAPGKTFTVKFDVTIK
jgi:uncharacterized repeat protein (TIGR01451 family)